MHIVNESSGLLPPGDLWIHVRAGEVLLAPRLASDQDLGQPFVVAAGLVQSVGRRDLSADKKRIWIEDQYRHPLERMLALPQVVGVLEEQGGFTGDDDTVYVPLTTAQTRFFTQRTLSGERPVAAIYASVVDESQVAAAISQIEWTLRERHNLGPDDVDVAEVYDLSSALELDWYENIGLCKPGDLAGWHLQPGDGIVVTHAKMAKIPGRL